MFIEQRSKGRRTWVKKTGSACFSSKTISWTMVENGISPYEKMSSESLTETSDRGHDQIHRSASKAVRRCRGSSAEPSGWGWTGAGVVSASIGAAAREIWTNEPQ